MRGKLSDAFSLSSVVRNIPAYAGKTLRNLTRVHQAEEHPRVCGENPLFTRIRPRVVGTSPRMRGKPGALEELFVNPRNIPAYAGKTMPMATRMPPMAEHPRVCGENCVAGFTLVWVAGTSPRMRGKPWSPAVLFYAFRNIPAYAGKTPLPTHLGAGAEEHPRVCGENLSMYKSVAISRGTSPRMRGKPACRNAATHQQGNIPAYAGKTMIRFSMLTDLGEHPRVCGENVQNQ